jgi:hypothetical protein
VYSNNPHTIDDLKMAITEYIRNVHRDFLITLYNDAASFFFMAARCKVVHVHRFGILKFSDILNHAIKNVQKPNYLTVTTVLVLGLIKNLNYTTTLLLS